MVVVPTGDGEHDLVLRIHDGAEGRVDQGASTTGDKHLVLVVFQALLASDEAGHLRAQRFHAVGLGVVGVSFAVCVDDLVHVGLG